MMKLLLLLLLLMLVCSSQYQVEKILTSCYQTLKNEGQQLYKQQQYEQAINKYLAALNCENINQSEIARLIKQAQKARQSELILERNTAQVNALTSQAILALKQELNPAKACNKAFEALQIIPSNNLAWGAFIDAWYSQVFTWKGKLYAVPMAETFYQTGILGTSALSPDGQIFATASWDPPIVTLWPLNGGDTIYLLGFSSMVWKLCFSPDSDRIAVASLDGTARIYSKTGHLLHRLTEHNEAIFGIEFSTDGQYLITASEDSSAIIWNAHTGEKLTRLKSPLQSAVRNAAFSPDNRLAITADINGKAFIWDIEGNTIGAIDIGNVRITSAIFSPDSRRIIIAGKDGRIMIYDDEGNYFGENRQKSAIEALAVSPNQSFLVIGTKDGAITTCDMAGQTIQTFQAHETAINGIVFSPDSTHYLTYSHDNTLKIWNTDGKLILMLGEFTGPVLSAGFSKDGNTVYASSWDGSAKLFRLDGHPILEYSGLDGSIFRVRLSTDEQNVVAITSKGRALLWNKDGTKLKQCSPEAGWLKDAVYAPNGQQVLISSDKGLILWNLNTDNWLYLDHIGANNGCFFPDGKIVTGAEDGSLKIWTNTGDFLLDLGKVEGSVSALDISKEGSLVISGHDDGTVALWSVTQKKAIWQHQYHTGEVVESVCFSPNGRYFLSAGGDNRAFLWNKKGEPERVYKHAAPLNGASFSRDGRTILSYSVDGTTKLWAYDKDDPLTILRMPTNVTCAVLSRDQQIIVTGSNDGVIRVWSREGTLLASLTSNGPTINWLALSNNSDWLVSCSANGEVIGWDLDPNSLQIKPGF